MFRWPLTKARLKRWEKYAQHPWEILRDLEPDVVFIDGRFRVACALETIRNLSPNSSCKILIDDYVGRPEYHIVELFTDVIAISGRMVLLQKKKDLSGREIAPYLSLAYQDWR